MDLRILFFYIWSLSNGQIIGPPGRKQQYSTAADYEVHNRIYWLFIAFGNSEISYHNIL